MNDAIEDTRKRKYAKLLLEVGVNLQPGQKLLVAAEPYHWKFLNLVAEEAYKMGAGFVLVDADDPGLLKARVDHGQEQDLDKLVGWSDKQNHCLIDDGWARLRLFGPTDPDLMGTLNGQRLGIIQKTQSIAGKPVSEACAEGKITWCVAALPTPGWAAKVYDCEPSAEVERRLWLGMVKILNLDADDPSAHWIEKGEMLLERCAKLSKLNLAEVRFRGPGTDLSVKCIAGAKWIGGGVPTEKDAEKTFIPNLPTEECFTTPNRRGTEGRMQVVRPVTVLGQSVEGAWFEFEDGKVISYGAKVNKGVLDDYFEMCPNACYLGELALVDGSSPIFKNGHVFHCILYDENASCHVALGSGYPMPVEGATKMTDDEKKAAGINVSIVHTDFMIGGPDVEVTGYDGAGKEIPLIRGGDFVI
ncbi:MAG: aminopeptidase [Akkermansiaceae bacterium]